MSNQNSEMVDGVRDGAHRGAVCKTGGNCATKVSMRIVS